MDPSNSLQKLLNLWRAGKFVPHGANADNIPKDSDSKNNAIDKAVKNKAVVRNLKDIVSLLSHAVEAIEATQQFSADGIAYSHNVLSGDDFLTAIHFLPLLFPRGMMQEVRNTAASQPSLKRTRGFFDRDDLTGSEVYVDLSGNEDEEARPAKKPKARITNILDLTGLEVQPKRKRDDGDEDEEEEPAKKPKARIANFLDLSGPEVQPKRKRDEDEDVDEAEEGQRTKKTKPLSFADILSMSEDKTSAFDFTFRSSGNKGGARIKREPGT